MNDIISGGCGARMCNSLHGYGQDKCLMDGYSFVGEVPGTSEISSKLLFPVPPLVQYLRQKHGLFQNGLLN